MPAPLDDLRALARGIYPPLLADQGLGPAVQAQTGRAPLPVLVEADGIGRYPREAEAAVNFCICEALLNVAKYARAPQATIAVSCPDGQLEFRVADDGASFDAACARHCTGLQGIADRLAAVGGTFRVRSAPELGTTVAARCPYPSRPEPGASATTRRGRPPYRHRGHGGTAVANNDGSRPPDGRSYPRRMTDGPAAL